MSGFLSHVSENASETQIDNTMTFTVLIVSIEQNEEFQESRVHYTLAGIKSLLKIGEGGGGFRNPWNPPLATPLTLEVSLRYQHGSRNIMFQR